MNGLQRVKPWKSVAETGPKWGVAVSPETMARIIKEAENPLLIIGGDIDELDGKLLDFVKKLSKTKSIPIVATAHSITRLDDSVDATIMGFVEVTNVLLDPDWGLKGTPHDLVIYVGIEYSLTNMMLNSLKNFSEVKTASLSRYYQPNASVSLANLTDDIWAESLEKISERVV
ncbi:MAG: CO dehydrogenase/acetyl-CoA synthase complex subunit epsilon [Candidatus Hydrothermarchaeales archaeon]